ncbi:aldo/keto reductase [Streptococcus cuniculipharyngis]|uniref:Aldo/keto reductase family oxidoreductase n=1 Tax=Streptococcus cuniculipharyngis TaxID=1562651 RepID=A0A5C5SGK6_9STRE|nr:aldo/keto reductase [Streptococcus cuniculipharyngis]TWS99258.1 aldo/keto reductase family oxidoreductase [Streptococcus cuniculipharyngis]
MKYMRLGQSDLLVPRLALGCMRMSALSLTEAKQVIQQCLDLGINFFDHADIYGKGQSERIFGQAIKELGLEREQVIIQSKCGIRPGFFDFSKEHILAAVDGILERLQTDYLDLLVLHRPDTLWEPEEVAAAFSSLKEQGKVRHFGLSNVNRYQMELLQAYWQEPLLVNQLQVSLVHTPMIDAGLQVNMLTEGGLNRDGGILDYCRLRGVTIQAWSPFMIDLAQGTFFDHPDYPELNHVLAELADSKGVSVEAIATAFLLRHPAQMQVLVGSMNPDRLQKIAAASQVELSRQEWYRLYLSAGKELP